MAEGDIQVLLEVLRGLKADMKDNTDKLDALIRRLDVEICPKLGEHDAAIQDVIISIGKTNVALKACVEDTNSKISAITTLVAPAVDMAEDTEKVVSLGKKAMDFISKNWKYIALLLLGVIGAKYPELAKWLSGLLALASGTPPVVPQ